MALSYTKLKTMTEEELIAVHDNRPANIGGIPLRETHESIRNELFRRELKKSMKIQTRLTWIMAVLTFIILILTVILTITTIK